MCAFSFEKKERIVQIWGKKEEIKIKQQASQRVTSAFLFSTLRKKPSDSKPS